MVNRKRNETIEQTKKRKRENILIKAAIEK
jgi:hypothetical protein